MAEDDFDAIGYWQERHVRLRGDYRNVGNIGLTSARNHDLIVQKMMRIVHHLGRLGVEPGSTVLDAGCGAGAVTLLLQHVGFSCTGIDPSPTAIEDARGSCDAEFVVSTIGEFERPCAFTVVMCLDVLYHVVDDEEWTQSLMQLARCVEPGGLVVILEHFPGVESTSPYCRWRTMEAYEALLAQLGLEVALHEDFQYPGEVAVKTLIVARRPA